MRFTFDEPKEWGVSSPIIAGGQIYIDSFNGKFYSLNLKTGKPIWEFQTESSKKDVLKILKADGTFDDAAVPKTFFDFQDDYVDMFRRFSVGSKMSTPAVADSEIYFGSPDGNFYALQ